MKKDDKKKGERYLFIDEEGKLVYKFTEHCIIEIEGILYNLFINRFEFMYKVNDPDAKNNSV